MKVKVTRTEIVNIEDCTMEEIENLLKDFGVYLVRITWKTSNFPHEPNLVTVEFVMGNDNFMLNGKSEVECFVKMLKIGKALKE